MKKIVFYFHGYKSSAKSDKAEKLKKSFGSAYAFDIDIDPEVSLHEVSAKIIMQLIEHINDEDAKIVFVGTSLGAWYASKLAKQFGVECVAINPCYSPSTMLAHHGVPEKILSKYDEMEFLEDVKYFISTDDEVIDFSPVKEILDSLDTTWVEKSNHRFNGPEFESVIKYIEEL